MSGKERYHHGDLRNALLRAALAILEEEGLDALSLRAVAARAGVSHAAPAHHFPALKHLLTAVAADAFARFRQALRDGEAAARPQSVRARFGAAGDAYASFATANPQAFRLMFSPSRLDWSDPSLQAAGNAAYDQLASICAPVADARGETTPEARKALELLVWSAMHGYTQLLLAGQLGGLAGGSGAPPPRPDLENLLLGPEAE